MRLTQHFTLAEMIRSTTAVRRGISNTPPPSAVAALKLLCENVLEPVRVHFGRPVIVSSGYRSPALNKAIGGSASSQHCQGLAADFEVPGVSNIDLCRWIVRNLRYDQLIYEFGEEGWVHCSYRDGNNRGQELTARRVKGRVVYLPGIVP